MSVSFNKFHGLGNDYLVYDIIKNKRELSAKDIKKICNRNFGFGSDGILVGPYIDGSQIGVKIYNPDGSEAESSGNGVRIFAKYLKDAGYIKDDYFILNTLGGEIGIKFNNKSGTNTVDPL